MIKSDLKKEGCTSKIFRVDIPYLNYTMQKRIELETNTLTAKRLMDIRFQKKKVHFFMIYINELP